MKKIVTTLVLACMASVSFAQLTYWKDSVIYSNFPKDGADHHLADTVYNNTASPYTFTWRKSSETLLTGMTGVSVCFLPSGACYDWTNAALSHTETIPAGGKAFFEVAMRANATAVDGCSEVIINSDSKNLKFKFCVWPTSVKEYTNNNIVSIYPNPASSYINMQLNDKNISTVSISNIVGKQFGTYHLDATKSNIMNIPVDNFANGIYLLSFKDANGKTLGVKRVSKN